MTIGGGDQAARLRGELARLGPLTPFEILGVAPTAGADAIRSAFLSATKKFHPNLFGRASPDVQDLATEVFLVVKRAYSQLSDETKRKAQKERVATGERIGPASAAAMAPAAPRSVTPEVPPVAPRAVTPPVAFVAPGAPVAPKAVAPVGPVASKAIAPPVAPPSPPRAPVSRPPRPEKAVAPQPPPSLQGGPKRTGPATTTDVQAILDAAKTRSSRFEQANRLMSQGQFEPAREILQRIATEDPQNRRYRIRLHLAWGLEHRGQRRYEEAVREIERALALDPENAEVADALLKTREQGAQRGIFSKLFGR